MALSAVGFSPYAMIQVGPIAFLIALLALPIYYILHVRAPQPKQTISLATYLLVSFAIGIASFALGTMLGIAVACMPDDAGNLCGLAGIFGAGPLTSAVALVAYAHLKTRAARRVPAD